MQLSFSFVPTSIDSGSEMAAAKVVETDETATATADVFTNAPIVDNATVGVSSDSAATDFVIVHYSTYAATADNHHYYMILDTNCYCYTYFNIIDCAFESSKL